MIMLLDVTVLGQILSHKVPIVKVLSADSIFTKIQRVCGEVKMECRSRR